MLTQDTYTYPGKLISNFILEEDVLCNIGLNISGIIIMMMISILMLLVIMLDLIQGLGQNKEDDDVIQLKSPFNQNLLREFFLVLLQ